MNAVNLEKSLEKLRSTYVGKDKDGVHQLDMSKTDELGFLVAMNRVSVAIKNGEITESEFLKTVTKKGKKNAK